MPILADNVEKPLRRCFGIDSLCLSSFLQLSQLSLFVEIRRTTLLRCYFSEGATLNGILRSILPEGIFLLLVVYRLKSRKYF